ncbi:MAG: SpoVG family protein [bacterium]
MDLEVTSVKIDRAEDSSERLYAYASVVLNEEFVVHNLRLVEADSGKIISMPNERSNGEFRDVAHPITSECRQRILKAVVEEYNKQVEQGDKIKLND